MRRFFETMEAYFDGALSTGELFAAHPGWTERCERVELYRSFVQAHGRELLDKLYPLCRAALGSSPSEAAGAWDALCSAYVAAHPSQHFEVNLSGEGFAAFLADNVERRGLPPFLPALARFEWLDFAVYASAAEPEGAVNPTLELFEHPFRLCAWVRSGQRAHPPETGHERVLMWRHPRELKTYFVEADDRLLLGLKVVLEGTPLEEAAREAGWPIAELEALVAEMGRDGLVVSIETEAPTSRSES